MHNTRAFTLVELSIVLVILGLLVGGVLAGQSLIRAAELRSVTTDINNYKTAMYSFRDKYFALPGDMTNATTFWGAAHATPATCITTIGTGTQTCDGNGDGRITRAGSLNLEPYEMFRGWQQLSNAGLIEGNYTGVAGPHAAGIETLIGTNVPRSRIKGAGYSLYRWTSTVDFYWGAADYGHILVFGTQWPNYTTTGPALPPEEQYNLEMKMDDGMPYTGTIITLFNTGCATGNAVTDTYSLSNPALLCNMIYKLGF